MIGGQSFVTVRGHGAVRPNSDAVGSGRRGSANTASSRCLRLGTTVKATKYARVYVVDRRLYGCLKPRGRSWFIWYGRHWPDPARDALDKLQLAGSYFAGDLPWAEGPFGGVLIYRTNLATGVTRTTAPITSAAMETPLVERLILTRGGGVAWGALSSQGRTIRCWGRRGHVRVLDSDLSVHPQSLRLTGSVLTWMRGNSPRSAPMC
jgi:hypothetical protein